jgi:hypothetical protein
LYILHLYPDRRLVDDFLAVFADERGGLTADDGAHAFVGHRLEVINDIDVVARPTS